MVIMTLREKAERKAVATVVRKLIRYTKKDPDNNLPKLIDYAEKFVGKIFPSENFIKMREGVKDPENVWRKLALSVLNDTDEEVLVKMALAFGLGAGVHGTKAVRENREKLNCNIPWLILFDPTSACNKNCTGCWSAEYGHKLNLTYEEMESIVEQGTEMGTHLYMFTGGEPLIRRKDIIKLCKNHPDCVFLSFTNATLIDQSLCDEMREVGNFTLMLSIEGTPETNDMQ